MNTAAMPRAGADARDLDHAFCHRQDPVRHAYPLAVADASLSTAFGLMLKTLPYALARFGVLCAYAVTTLLWAALALGGLKLLGHISPLIGIGWLLMMAAVGGFAWRTALRYGLYLLKAGHIAVLTELITRGQVGYGQEGMFTYGKRVVQARFGQVTALFTLDLLVRGVVRAFNRGLNWLSRLLPVPGLPGVVRVVNRLVHASTTYIDETLLSYSLARGDDNPYRCAQEGLVYYAQNAKPVLKTGVVIVCLDAAASALGWFLVSIPIGLLAGQLPGSTAGLGALLTFLAGVILAGSLRSAFLQPLFLTMVMLKFHVTVQGQPIDATWDDRLEGISRKFVELKERALSERSAVQSTI